MASRLREDVEALCAAPRDSAGPGERRAAQEIATRLRAAGVHEVSVEPYRWQGTYAYAHLIHALAGLAAVRLRRPLLALAALVSYELEVSGRLQWIRALLPKGEGANVVARLPAAGERRRTVVVHAHHDAQRTGWIWRLPLRRTATEPAGALVAAGYALAATPWRRLGGALLAIDVVAMLDTATEQTVPGASDNATGVACVLELARRLTAEPPEHTETLLVSVGCEESGMGGMRAFLKAHDFDPATTFDLGVDTLGAGEPVILTAEGTVLPHRYAAGDVERVEAAARAAGLEPPRRVRLGTWTDAILARFRGLPAASLLSLDEHDRFTNFHVMTDTPDRVDWASVERCVAIAEAVVRHGH